MALTDQPYLPLYVDDWMNNNKLKVCSPQAHGIMVTVMCIMHKEKEYGKILLKQKFKQTDKQIENFALQVARQSSFDLLEILPALQELVDEDVLRMEGEYLICIRMVKDAELSVKRAVIGQKGGKKTQSFRNEFASDFAKANGQANTGNEIVINNTTQQVKHDRNETKKSSTNFRVQGEEVSTNRVERLRKELESD